METVAARIYGAIKEQIIDGRYAPGARITEQAIAAEFSTSRTPVREAMRQLVADGFARFKPNSGTVVREWTPEQMAQVFELRVFIESEIAGYAATRITAQELAELVRLQDEIEAHGPDTGAENTARIGRLNREFHRILAEASRNERLVAMLASAIEVPIVQQTFRRYTTRQLARSFGHHRELIDALATHDSAWAKSVMSSHIHSAKQTLLGAHRHGQD
ncbi:MAG: GntR family transcriptional regulator [Rubrivivax sp.]|nr:GntR family transcriptional regulator [Rubrivivax sp.]